MNLNDLTTYVAENYHIEEQHKWADFPGFSVLSDPTSGKWLALLMRQWEDGVEYERCDIKCGHHSLLDSAAPFLGRPFRMHGWNWVGVTFDATTRPEVVFALFDRALLATRQPHGATIVLPSQGASADAFHDTRIFPASALPARPARAEPSPPPEAAADLPEPIRKMRQLYRFGTNSFAESCQNFYRQGKFMEDYEDDAPWDHDLYIGQPTYHDLNLPQLRGYFTWRTQVRKGQFRRANTVFAYLYFYELLNLIGARAPEDALQKMQEFLDGFFALEGAPAYLRNGFRSWMLDFAIIHRLPVDTARQYLAPGLLENDLAMAVLKNCANHSDDEVFAALCRFAPKRFADTPVVTQHPNGKHLFAAAWRHAATHCRQGDKDLFTYCFGEMAEKFWQPLSGAIFDWTQLQPKTQEYVLDECRKYFFRDGEWHEELLWNPYQSLEKLPEFLHETDRQLRRYLKTGRYLRAKEAENWAEPFAKAVVAAEQQARRIAAMPVVTIKLDQLERIRQDALVTQDSLLTEDEHPEPPAPPAPPEPPEPPVSPKIPLEPLQSQLLTRLLRGEDIRNLIRQNRLLPSVVADAINEACFAAVGDSVVDCDGDAIALVEDYRAEIQQIVEENQHE